MAGERAFTASLARFFGTRPGVLLGIGDDAAVVRNPARDAVLCCDPVVEGVQVELGTPVMEALTMLAHSPATVLLVREYGAGLDRYELGLPKGRLDQDETVEQGANRELKEEIGFGARDLRILTNLSLSPSYMTSMTHVVLARDLYPERLVGDEPEELEVVEWKLSQLHHLLSHPEVTEGRSIAALFIAREYLAGRFEPRA